MLCTVFVLKRFLGVSSYSLSFSFALTIFNEGTYLTFKSIFHNIILTR